MELALEHLRSVERGKYFTDVTYIRDKDLLACNQGQPERQCYRCDPTSHVAEKLLHSPSTSNRANEPRAQGTRRYGTFDMMISLQRDYGIKQHGPPLAIRQAI